MPKENERIKSRQRKHTEPIKPNIKLISAGIILTAAIVIKLIPSSPVKTCFQNIVSTTTDYPGMFSEITEVIKKHTFSSADFILPATGEITSPFGERTDPVTSETATHFGIDIDAASNTEIRASAGGKVLKAEANSYYGNFVMIAHNEEFSTLYGHLNEILVKPGDEISASDIIGLSGDSGRTTGPHLHFEIRKNNIPVNPLDYLSK